MRRVHLVIRGRVQGVGFRVFVLRHARALGLAGEVRNRADESVELEAEGDPDALRELTERVRRGPSGARVTAVEERWSDAPASHHGFEISG